jgi:hypothetical protein
MPPIDSMHIDAHRKPVAHIGIFPDDDGMAWLYNITFDCRHPASLARFWAAVLDGYEVAPYDEVELERLRGKGIFDTEDDPSVLVERPGGPGPRYIFQLVPEGKAGEPRAGRRTHLDIIAIDRTRDEEVERLKGLGATEFEDHRKPDGTGWVTMADPEGNLFCVEPSASERA